MLIYGPRFRRRICLAWLGLFVIGLVGVPLPPAKTTDITGGERFPCEDCPCGCVDAATCWERCCCLDDVGKLRWAESNGVTPPAFLVRRAAKQKGGSPPPRCCCCRTQCGDEKTVSAVESGSESTKVARVPPWVSVVRAAECRGLKSWWTSLGFVVPVEENDFDAVRSSQRLSVTSDRTEGRGDSPPTPVPWKSAV